MFQERCLVVEAVSIAVNSERALLCDAEENPQALSKVCGIKGKSEDFLFLTELVKLFLLLINQLFGDRNTQFFAFDENSGLGRKGKFLCKDTSENAAGIIF